MNLQGTISGRKLPRLLGLVALALGLTALIVGGGLAWTSWKSERELVRAERLAEAQAAGIAAQAAEIRQGASSEGVNETARAVLAGQVPRTALVQALRQRRIGNVLDVVVAPAAVEQADVSMLPGTGFAALEMMFTAQDEGAAPFEAHFAGTPDEYLAFARSFEYGGPAPGVLLITQPLSVLTTRLELPGGLDGLALAQRVEGRLTTLRNLGTPVHSDVEAIPVPGTRFVLTWHKSTILPPLSMMQLAGVLGIGLLLLALGAILLRRSARVESHDEAVIGAEEDEEPAQEEEPARSPAERAPPPAPKDISHPAEERDEPAGAEQDETADEDRPPETARRDELPPLLSGEDEPEPRDDAGEHPEGSLLDDQDEETGDDVLSDGEARRERVEQRTLDAPELLGEVSETDTDAGSRDEQGEESGAPLAAPEVSGEDGGDDEDFEAEDEDDLSRMLQSLMDEDDEDEAIEPDAAAIEERPARPAGEVPVPDASIFRAYDIRGVVDETLDADVAEALGRAIGSEAISRGLTRIAVARDGRLSGATLLAALGRGLVASGLEVIDVGAVPTPVLYFAAQELAGGSGVMVTGSHNPPEYNGFKIMLGGETLSGDAIAALRERLERGELESGEGRIGEERIAAKYVERIATDIQLERSLKIVVDCGNGITGHIGPKLLTAVGAEVIPLYAEVDGTFPNHHPDPGDPKTLEDLKLCVRNFQADLGIAFDGDGDRLGVVAPDGEIIYPDRLMMLFARDVLSRVPGAPIIYDVKCTGMLADEIEKAGGKPLMARTGHSFIKARLKKEDAPLAGEMSGHFFFAERWMGFDDGMYAAARLLELLAADTRAVGQILGSLPNAESTPEMKVPMKEGEPHAFVEAFREKAEFDDAEIHTVDGVRADFPDGFGLVRASNTTPVLVVRFEGRDKDALSRIQERFREAMLEINPALKLPF
ncbi:MAG: phosphomannomutase/phosphoglucomutase [Wenzhouxiangellaceae bacterium]|nr:phosphomannomutase/phosphoglucomutase [Wenzhouxiangellaceae bacterium]